MVFLEGGSGNHIFRIRKDFCCSLRSVRKSLDQQLAEFLRQKRGKMTYAHFSRKTGLPLSTIFRLENCEQSITLGRLDRVLARLKCKLSDVFAEE